MGIPEGEEIEKGAEILFIEIAETFLNLGDIHIQEVNRAFNTKRSFSKTQFVETI